MATGATTAGELRATASSQKFFGRYLVIACLFTVTLIMQVRSAVSVFLTPPIHVAHLEIEDTTPAIQIANAEAAAAALHKGDIILAVNDRPYTGRIIYYEEFRKATA